MSGHQAISPAETVWNTPDLREEIFFFCKKNEQIKLMRVSKDLFVIMAAKVGHVRNKRRLKIYRNSIKSVEFPVYFLPSKVPAPYKWPKILEKYPNATKISHDPTRISRIEAGDVHTLHRERYLTVSGLERWRYTYEYVITDYLDWSEYNNEKIMGLDTTTKEIDLIKHKPYYIFEDWNLKKSLKLKMITTKEGSLKGQVQPTSNEPLKRALIKKIKSLPEEIELIELDSDINTSLSTDVLLESYQDLVEMLSPGKEVKKPKILRLRYPNNKLADLLNIIPERLTYIYNRAMNYEETEVDLSHLLRTVNWDKLVYLDYLSISARRDLPATTSSVSESSRTTEAAESDSNNEHVDINEINFSKDTVARNLPLPHLKVIEIDIHYPQGTELTCEQFQVEEKWVKNIAKLFRQLMPKYDRQPTIRFSIHGFSKSSEISEDHSSRLKSGYRDVFGTR
ncbi:uncharacterized protein L201_006115 [Kwoniella dendrophila CBS 6074]|uniref:Uncharacterized protein n=1 Tax=Kwoniella dendrophila CBS 6074 TaxID=1295534 RepID=A0AAX4K1X2_9TREE